MKIKKGDNVIVTAGKDKGSKGIVTRVFRDTDKVLVAGVQKVTRHQKPKSRGEKGTIIQVESPLHASNVMIIDPKTGKGSRIAKKKVGDAYVRISKKSGQEIK